ncbi:hypothetical protein AAFF_G00113350 [Aldrovandia affinis]|uniref:Uncharacterized protein n=1 Tax=Aldrovandia affinis TaxID=143900 RepID=A0AAD7RT24_9TELE|nr:hypothetical protein AAFF_G00113350 [Aldrovandia affinis]
MSLSALTLVPLALTQGLSVPPLTQVPGHHGLALPCPAPPASQPRKRLTVSTDFYDPRWLAGETTSWDPPPFRTQDRLTGQSSPFVTATACPLVLTSCKAGATEALMGSGQQQRGAGSERQDVGSSAPGLPSVEPHYAATVVRGQARQRMPPRLKSDRLVGLYVAMRGPHRERLQQSRPGPENTANRHGFLCTAQLSQTAPLIITEACCERINPH